MRKIKNITLKNKNTYIKKVPIGVEDKNIELLNGFTLQKTIGKIDINKDGNIKHQIEELQRELSYLVELYKISNFSDFYYILKYINKEY